MLKQRKKKMNENEKNGGKKKKANYKIHWRRKARKRQTASSLHILFESRKAHASVANKCGLKLEMQLTNNRKGDFFFFFFNCRAAANNELRTPGSLRTSGRIRELNKVLY